MADCCPFCGAELSFAAERCRDCNLSQDPGAEPALVADDSIDEVAYEVSDWPVGSRLRLTGILAERGIPWRWEPVLNLVVREEDDVAAEAALDEIEAEELGGGGIGVGSDNEEDSEEDDEGTDDGYEDDDEEEEEDDDEVDDDGAVAQAAMADLFVAADRLMHEPESLSIAVDLDTAADVIDASPAPFGIDDETWSTIRRQAAAVRAALDESESDKLGAGEDAVASRDTADQSTPAADADYEGAPDDEDRSDDEDRFDDEDGSGDTIDDEAVADAVVVERAQALRDTLRPWV